MKPERLPAQRQEGAGTATETNVMPSMVLRQQRIQMVATSANQYQLTESIHQQHQHQLAGSTSANSKPVSNPANPINTHNLIKAAKQFADQKQLPVCQQHEFNQDGLVLPRRVIHQQHPVSLAHPIIRDLNRELKFNQISGKNVLDQKSELERALDKLKESKRKKEAEQERLTRRSSLELRLQERADKIAKQSDHNQQKQWQPEESHPQHSQQQPEQQSRSNVTTSAPQGPSVKALSSFSIKSVTR